MITGSEEQYCTEWCQWSPAPRDSQVPVPRGTMQHQDQADRDLHPKPWQILCCLLLPSAATWAGWILSLLWPLAICKGSGPGHPLAPTPFTPKITMGETKPTSEKLSAQGLPPAYGEPPDLPCARPTSNTWQLSFCFCPCFKTWAVCRAQGSSFHERFYQGGATSVTIKVCPLIIGDALALHPLFQSFRVCWTGSSGPWVPEDAEKQPAGS